MQQAPRTLLSLLLAPALPAPAGRQRPKGGRAERVPHASA